MTDYTGHLKGMWARIEEGILNKRSLRLKGMRASIEEGLSNKRSLREIFGDVDDDFWYWLFTDGYDNNEIVRKVLPGMPDERIQAKFTGRSGHLALEQAYAFYRLSKDILSRNSRNLDECTAVLDFGCGWGRIIRFFLKDVEESGIWGIDCYKEMIDLCKTQNLRCNFEVTDTMPPTSFESNTFDLIYLYSVFSHLSEEAHLAWLKEFERILKPGGMVVATTRPRAFIEHCRDLSKRTGIENWQRGAAKSFADPEEALADYDSGKFVHSPTGGGGVLSTSFYGETCIPKKYVEDNWTRIFSTAGLIPVEEHGSFDQAVIFAKK